MKKQMIRVSVEQLRRSLEELQYIGDYLKNELSDWGRKLESTDYFYQQIKKLAEERYKLLSREIYDFIIETEILTTELTVSLNSLQEKDLIKHIEKRKILFLTARSVLSSYASLVTFLNWQSPSLRSSKKSRMGIEKYPINWDFNDYKRDRSNDTIYLEKQLEKKLLISKGTGVKPVLRLFNCGMAAFTSIIYALLGEKLVTNKVLLSSSIYVEALLLMNKFFADRLYVIKTNDTGSIISEILQKKPNVVILEPLSNTADMPLFDVETIVKEVSSKYKEDIYFIIDVTCFIGFENIVDNFKIPKNIKIIFHGSILKSPQVGMERVNSGFVMSFGLEHFKHDILDYRTFSGTNMQDICANLFPVFSRKLVKRRQLIIQRNTVAIAKHLKSLDSKHSIFEAIVYPGLHEHADHMKAKRMGFAGPFMNIKFLPKIMTDKHFEYFTNNFIESAKEAGCDVVHGASYGFNETSIYYALGWEGFGDHYIRLSVGTETPYEIEKIKDAFTKVVHNFKKKFNVI